MRLKDETGNVYGRLTVVKIGPPLKKQVRWYCQCSCGNSNLVLVIAYCLRSNKTKSCGCLRMEWQKELAKGNIKHGMSYSNEYETWSSIKDRCYNSNIPQYQYYGALGITVCDRWKDSFENFIADMGLRPEGKTLDRKNTKGNYEPSNCRWATPRQQSVNRRVMQERSLPPYIYESRNKVKTGYEINVRSPIFKTVEEAVTFRNKLFEFMGLDPVE